MSDIPPIEMRWGGGKWPGGFKRTARPWIQSAIDIARDGMEFLDVPASEPKRLTVWCVGSNFPEIGSAEGPVDIDLYLPYKWIKRHKLGGFLIPLSLTVLHEATHATREEYISQDNLAERIVTEGIAHWAEYLCGQALLKKPEFDYHYGNFQRPFDRDAYGHLMNAFIEDATYEATLDPDSSEVDDLYGVWFDSDATNLSAGVRLGMMCVGQWLDVGTKLSELVTVPTEDILTVGI